MHAPNARRTAVREFAVTRTNASAAAIESANAISMANRAGTRNAVAKPGRDIR